MSDSPTWPDPPEFMYDCWECWLLRRFLHLAAETPPGCFAEQMALSRHIVRDHPDHVPAPHADDCPLCPSYALCKDGDPFGFWAEHRSRDLFMPAEVARLM
ncbi:hypothetical protein [Streptomyces sp. NPDC016675]|uniref:hypothetical protein n=1 Tax=Streptomyces sp. NPDC016675 TaxID=3364970 RepID=UPI0036F888C3